MTDSQMEGHISNDHRELNSAQRMAFLAVCRRQTPPDSTSWTCVLCDAKGFNTVRKYGSHVCRHMEDIALGTLPREMYRSDNEESVLSNGSIIDPINVAAVFAENPDALHLPSGPFMLARDLDSPLAENPSSPPFLLDRRSPTADPREQTPETPLDPSDEEEEAVERKKKNSVPQRPRQPKREMNDSTVTEVPRLRGIILALGGEPDQGAPNGVAHYAPTSSVTDGQTKDPELVVHSNDDKETIVRRRNTLAVRKSRARKREVSAALKDEIVRL